MSEIHLPVNRKRVDSFPSPDGKDMVFYEEVSADGVPAFMANPRYGADHPDHSRWPDHELVYVTPEDERGFRRLYFAAKRTTQNLYNWRIRQVSGTGRGWDLAERYYLVRRSDYVDGVDYADEYGGYVGDTNPLASYTLAAGVQVAESGIQELDSLYVVIKAFFLNPSTHTDQVYSAEIGAVIEETRTISDTPSSSDLTDGAYGESVQLNERVYLNTTSNIGDLDRTYTTVENFYWPAVLLTIPVISPVEALDGGIFKNVVDADIRQAYNGPTKVVVTETFHSTAPSIIDPSSSVLLPKYIDYQGLVFNWRGGPFLHPTIVFFESIGTRGYRLASGQFRIREFPATNYTDWQDVTIERVRPYRGGYIKTSKVYSPPTV